MTKSSQTIMCQVLAISHLWLNTSAHTYNSIELKVLLRNLNFKCLLHFLNLFGCLLCEKKCWLGSGVTMFPKLCEINLSHSMCVLETTHVQPLHVSKFFAITEVTSHSGLVRNQLRRQKCAYPRV